MTFKNIGSKYFLRLNKGEEIISILTKFCRDQNITFGSVSGIGGAEAVTLGWYELSSKSYHWQDFLGNLEVISLTGNVAMVDNDQFLHIHCVISNETFESFGGHLKSGIVGGTLEVVMEKLEGPVERKMDENIGLKLLDY